MCPYRDGAMLQLGPGMCIAYAWLSGTTRYPPSKPDVTAPWTVQVEFLLHADLMEAVLTFIEWLLQKLCCKKLHCCAYMVREAKHATFHQIVVWMQDTCGFCPTHDSSSHSQRPYSAGHFGWHHNVSLLHLGYDCPVEHAEAWNAAEPAAVIAVLCLKKHGIHVAKEC